MADLWELVKQDANQRVSTHFIVASIKGRQANIEDSGVGFTAAQIVSSLESMRTEENHPALTTGEKDDLSAINTVLVGLPTMTSMLTYANLVEALFIAAEMGQVSETKWRSDLGI